MSPSLRQEALVLSASFLFNLFFFGAWFRIGEVVTKPWTIFVWLYALGMFLPLVWRVRAPLVVFGIEWVLTVLAWPIEPLYLLYIPVMGVPVALHAVAANCSKKISLLGLLASAIPVGLDASSSFRIFDNFSYQIQSFIANGVVLVVATVGAWALGRATLANRQRVQELEREREIVREAVEAERRRIARELHDIVSDTTGKKAMAELRRLLRLLEAGHPSTYAAGTGERRSSPGPG